MTIERQFDQIVFECDGKNCNEFLETETKDFDDALEELRAAKWLARMRATEWLHICPACAEDETAHAFS